MSSFNLSHPGTPHAAQSSARTSTHPPTAAATPAPQQPPAQAIPEMPPPEDFDIFPDLTRLLIRLQSTPTVTDPSSSTAKDADKPLEIADFIGEANGIKRKLARTREKVMQLPDMERSVREQEEEIAELEARIAEMRGRLGGLGGSDLFKHLGQEGVEKDKEREGDIRMTG